MKWLASLKLRTKLIIAILIAAELPLLVTGIWFYQSGMEVLNEQAVNHLVSKGEGQRRLVESLFKRFGGQVQAKSASLVTISAIQALDGAADTLVAELDPSGDALEGMRSALASYHRNGAGAAGGAQSAAQDGFSTPLPSDPFAVVAQYHYLVRDPASRGGAGGHPSAYGQLHGRYHPEFQRFVKRFGYEDLYLADRQGRIIYSVAKGGDFGTSLSGGALGGSGLAEVVGAALASGERDSVHLSDRAPYAANHNRPAMFIASPIFDVAGHKLGALALRIPLQQIDAIFSTLPTMGETEQTYLIGNDLRIRARSGDGLGREVPEQLFDNDASRQAVQGASGTTTIINPWQQAALAAYAPLQIDGLNWGIVTEMEQAEVEAPNAVLKHVVWISNLLTLLIAIALASLVARAVNRELGGEPAQIKTVARQMAQGKLRPSPLRKKTGPGGAYGAIEFMKEKLTHIMQEVQHVASSVADGSREITASNNKLRTRTEEQAASLRQTASNMAQITGSVKQNADTARLAKELAARARHHAKKGGDVITDTIDAMARINEASGRITRIVDTIDEIAFQTNLLALNAAVEAAHAGDQGRGFAVVANEVRGLAQRSAEAASEIKQLIGDSVEKVEAGSRLVHRSGESLGHIVASTAKVSDLIADISQAGEQQAVSIVQVNDAIQEMDTMTRENAALVEQTAAASENLGEQATTLSHQLAFFQVHRESGAGDPKRLAPPAATYQGTERRSTSRPWQGVDGVAAVAEERGSASPRAVNGEQDWHEF